MALKHFVTFFALFLICAAKTIKYNISGSGSLDRTKANAIFGIGAQVRNFHGQDRMMVVNDTIKVTYPPYDVRPIKSGGTFEVPLEKSRQYRLKFLVKFQKGFLFENGGDLHGLCGGGCFASTGFHVVLGWTANRSIVAHTNYHFNNSYTFRTDILFKHIKLVDDKWIEIEMKVKLNTNQQMFDGYIEVNDYFLGGIKFINNDNRLINTFLFSTHMVRGSGQVSRHIEQHAYFKGFEVTDKFE